MGSGGWEELYANSGDQVAYSVSIFYPWPGLMSIPYSVSIPSSHLTALHMGETPSLKQPSPTGEKEEAGWLQFEPNLHRRRKLDSKRDGY